MVRRICKVHRRELNNLFCKDHSRNLNNDEYDMEETTVEAFNRLTQNKDLERLLELHLECFSDDDRYKDTSENYKEYKTLKYEIIGKLERSEKTQELS